jgi:hypothetical protein
MRFSGKLVSALLTAAVLPIGGCSSTGGGSGSSPRQALITTNRPWVWEGGSAIVGSIHGQPAVYGTQGVAAATNNPGGRFGAAIWTDASGNLWLFGGSGPASQSVDGLYSDLWEYSAASHQWAWVNGSNSLNTSSLLNGSYGVLGVAAASNAPPARTSPLTWVDSSGNLWMYGGNAVTTFNIPTTVTVYQYTNGTKNSTAVSTTSGSPVSSTLSTALNDLWEFNPSTGLWTWIAGNNISNQTFPANASYGKIGVTASTNYPGIRSGAASWVDASGNFWLFGGTGATTSSITISNVPASVSSCYSGTQTTTTGTEFNGSGSLSDLWEYNPSTNLWTWIAGPSSFANDAATVSGSATIESATNNAVGSYGTMGTAAASNEPGARYNAASWTDTAGNLWLFGGFGNIIDPDSTCVNTTSTTTTGCPAVTTTTTSCVTPATAVPSVRNDLWEFNTTSKEWTWVSGSSQGLNPTGVYGTQGTAAANNVPGGRFNAVSYTDTSGNLWLFGGQDFASTARNDLWEFNTSTNLWTWVNGTSSSDAPGNYGTLGMAANTNDVGARTQASGWTDKSGNFWIYGGTGFDSQGSSGALNDLWTFKP